MIGAVFAKKEEVWFSEVALLLFTCSFLNLLVKTSFLSTRASGSGSLQELILANLRMIKHGFHLVLFVSF